MDDQAPQERRSSSRGVPGGGSDDAPTGDAPTDDPTLPVDEDRLVGDGTEAPADVPPRPRTHEESRDRIRGVTGIAPSGTFDHDKIQRAVRLLFEAIGEDPDRPGIADTPARVAREYDEIFAGLLVEPADVLSVTFDENYDEIVMMRDIPFHSVCEHHLVPFAGEAHVAYLPNKAGQVTGLSKLARLVDVCAKRPGLQERMTKMIADAMEQALQPRGVMVVVEARHLCMEMRGIRKPGAQTVTSNVRGIFRDHASTRAEALALLRQ